MNLRCLVILIGLLISSSAFAKRFTSKYCEFELPIGWECALEGTEYVCQSTAKDRRREAIIILAAKMRGPGDSLGNYEAYLKKTKTYTLPGGKTQVSESKITKKKKVGEQLWIDSLHLASEIPGFYTRYLATVNEHLGVAVTFSVAKDHYNSYKNVFDKVVETLKVFKPNNIKNTEMVLKNKDENLLENSDNVYVPDDIGKGLQVGQTNQSGRGKLSGSKNADLIFYGLVGLAMVAFVIIRKRKK